MHNVWRKNRSWNKLISFHGLKLVNWEKMNRMMGTRRDWKRKRWMRVWLMMISSDTRFNRWNPYDLELIGSSNEAGSYCFRCHCHCLLILLRLRWLTHRLAECHFVYARAIQINLNVSNSFATVAKLAVIEHLIKVFGCDRRSLTIQSVLFSWFGERF